MKRWIILLLILFFFLMVGIIFYASPPYNLRNKMELPERPREFSGLVKDMIREEYETRLRKPPVLVKEETVLQCLHNTIQPGENIWECEMKISKKLGHSVAFQLLQQRETRGHVYGLWNVTVLGQPVFRLFTDNGIIESITEHPGLR